MKDKQILKYIKRKCMDWKASKTPAKHREVLSKYQDQLATSIQPYIEIKARKAKDLKLWESKFGGRPYLPQGQNIPTNNSGRALLFLGQINCEEVPPISPFPETGLLQFWILDDHMYGLGRDNTKQDNFRVIYFADVQEDHLNEDFSSLPETEYSPFEDTYGEYGLTFLKKEMPVTLDDFRFDTCFMEDPDEDADFFESYYEVHNPNGHRIGGYPHFTQTDPRAYGKTLISKDFLLLQIDTDDESSIMWGDNGVANFFINEKDLESKDFSKVLYNWDCS